MLINDESGSWFHIRVSWAVLCNLKEKWCTKKTPKPQVPQFENDTDCGRRLNEKHSRRSTSVSFRVISCQEADAETKLLTQKKAPFVAFLSRRYRRLWTVDKRVWPGLIAQRDEGPSRPLIGVAVRRGGRGLAKTRKLPFQHRRH